MPTHDVICPSCRQATYETVDGVYDPDVIVRPDMVRMKEPYAGWNWSGMSHDPGAGHGQMVCLHCEMPLAPSGRLTTKERPTEQQGDADAEEFKCKCGSSFKHASSLSRHKRICNANANND